MSPEQSNHNTGRPKDIFSPPGHNTKQRKTIDHLDSNKGFLNNNNKRKSTSVDIPTKNSRKPS